ncbi:uncharacterized protein LOC131678716 [Topomyia yanbarensis]|uniref:uncharacterized protein LOC131678716 n=1 Tax=Topomyia yanbarensis TaxID=2498891 RepID=UPI00273A9C26|nr:uncharacterized protein LOC131678716 [Topomyia yanbarensis]
MVSINRLIKLHTATNMEITLTLTLLMLLAASSHAQLLCFHCDDCESGTVAVEACNFNDPVQTTNAPIETTTVNTPTGDPVSTTSPALDTTTLIPDTTTSGDPILTPPTIPTWTPTQGSSLATPPITPQWGFESHSGRLIIPLPPQDQTPYVCSMVKFVDGQREVVRRGCARLGQNTEQTCSGLSGSSHHTRCTVCMTHLCNNGV